MNPYTLPPFLQEIALQAQQFQRLQPNLDTFAPAWQAYLEKAGHLPGIEIKDGGETVILGGLSPGCQACKDGTWDCIFITMRCNLNCPFCYSPSAAPPDFSGSVFGATPDEMARNYRKTRIHGISFSGGEPFLQPQKLLEWVTGMREAFPGAYIWVYTNGLLLDLEILRQLADLRLNELRFNTAATGYTHPTVMGNIQQAVTLIPNVTVEIPAIPEQDQQLLNSLAEWARHGVKYLNLHELIYEPGTPSASLAGPRQALITPDHHFTQVHPQSRLLTLKVMERVYKEGLNLAVNDCSMQNKLRQVRGRRLSLTPLTRQLHEKALPDGMMESNCAWDGEDTGQIPQQLSENCGSISPGIFLFHPNQLDEMRPHFPDHHFYRLVRLAPLSLSESPQWIEIIEITPGFSP